MYNINHPTDLLPRLWVDAQKFYQLTDFQASYSFADGLAETVAYYEAKMKEKDLLSQVKTQNWEK